MVFKIAIVSLTLIVGSLGFPTNHDSDMSVFFDDTDLDSRIWGGHPAGTVPWMVSLTYGSTVRAFMCGASIITNRHILTAGHCIEHVSDIRSIHATVGTNRWNSGGTTYNIYRNFTHPQYVPVYLYNDLSILVTTNNIVFNSKVAPVTLNFNFIGAGVQTRANGWGKTETGDTNILLELYAVVTDSNVCNEQIDRVSKEIHIFGRPVEPRTDICTFVGLKQGLCNGDSGSPVVRRDNNQQIGIVSWGLPCARGAPDVLVRVSAYRTWIEDTIREFL